MTSLPFQNSLDTARKIKRQKNDRIKTKAKSDFIIKLQWKLKFPRHFLWTFDILSNFGLILCDDSLWKHHKHISYPRPNIFSTGSKLVRIGRKKVVNYCTAVACGCSLFTFFIAKKSVDFYQSTLLVIHSMCLIWNHFKFCRGYELAGICYMKKPCAFNQFWRINHCEWCG